jgi:hypothetical protein
MPLGPQLLVVPGANVPVAKLPTYKVIMVSSPGGKPLVIPSVASGAGFNETWERSS